MWRVRVVTKTGTRDIRNIATKREAYERALAEKRYGSLTITRVGHMYIVNG